MSKNKILAIGHSVVDKIHIADIIEIKPGGIYFSVKGFLSAENTCDVSLLTEFTRENEKYFSPEYSNVKLVGDFYSKEMPVNHLFIYKDKERDEIYEYVPTSLNLNKISNFNHFYTIYINMISGFDVTLDDLKKLRSEFNGIIYLDIHTLSRGVFKNNTRKFRTIPEGIEWINNVDFVQANEHEIKTLSDELSFNQIVNRFFDEGGKAFIVTKGKNGIESYYKENNEIKFVRLKPNKISEKQCVGCGDFFGANFICNFINTRNILQSLNITLEKVTEFATN